MALFVVFDLVMFIDSLADILEKRPFLVAHVILVSGAAILIAAGISDPMAVEGRIACVAIAMVLLVIEVLLLVKDVRRKREAKAAQMPHGPAT